MTEEMTAPQPANPSRNASCRLSTDDCRLSPDDCRLLTVTFQRLNERAQLPRYAHPGDAGLDLAASEACTLAPGAWAAVPTGLKICLPPGTEAQVRPRSGLAARYGVTVLNAPGTIDEGYRGELKVLLINHGREAFQIEPGMRIAQLVVALVLRVEPVEGAVDEATVRGTGGFGSSGMESTVDSRQSTGRGGAATECVAEPQSSLKSTDL